MNIRTILAVSILLLSGQVGAALIDHGTYTEINGLDWLDLTETDALSVNDALAANPGWVLSTKSQYQSMHLEFDTPLDDLFMTFGSDLVQHRDGYDNYFSVNVEYDPNPFYSLFGITGESTATVGGTGFTSINKYAYGLYSENDELRIGGFQTFDVEPESGIYNYGAARYGDPRDESIYFDNHNNLLGSFLVRESISAVPAPAAVWLFGTGLLGLIGVKWRRKAA